MKYAITGHTQGIGLEIYNRLSPNIIGFSRSNGFDISKAETREKIIKMSKNVDIFINNAHNSFDQTLMFLELWNIWKNEPKKTIINVGSRIADVKCLSPERQNLIKYQAEKVILKEMSARVSGRCKVEYVSFGYVGTPAILKKYPNIIEKDYISVDRAADLIQSKCNI